MAHLPGNLAPQSILIEDMDFATILPVELIAFAGNYLEGSVNLEWSTAAEFNSDGFQIQHSRDGINFDAIAFVKSKESYSNAKIDYHFEAQTFILGTNFYRLSQIDLDGTQSVSQIITVYVKKYVDRVNVYSNPSSGFIKISAHQPGSRVRILTAKGIEMLTSDAEEINITDFPAGLYLVQIRTANNEYILKRLVKY